MIKVDLIVNNKREKHYLKEPILALDFLSEQGIYIPVACNRAGKCKKCTCLVNGEKVLSCQYLIESSCQIEINQTEEIATTVKKVNLTVNKIGIGLDLGTTTLGFYVVDLEKGELLESYSVLNKQANYGSDVISRIDYAINKSLTDLSAAVLTQVRSFLNYLKKYYPHSNVLKMVVAGNTVMNHLFLNVSPQSLGFAPYKPEFINKVIVEGEKLELKINEVVVFPSIDGYIGGDITSGLLLTPIYDENDLNILFVDFGTNGELVLKVGKNILATSAAVGPAFEGAKIEMGLGGVSGAIKEVKYLSNEFLIKTINDKEALGICGSGLTDVIAILLENKKLDFSGKLITEKVYLTKEVYLTQQDIREFQLAKSAVKSAIETLLFEAKITLKELDYLYLSGGFGFHLNKESAIKTGLIPNLNRDKIITIDNACGKGTIIGLLDSKKIELGENINKKIKVINLATNTFFNNRFIENILFEGEE